jgi:hypothetical protein
MGIVDDLIIGAAGALEAIAKGRRPKVHFPGETPPSEAMDPGLAEQMRGHVSQDDTVGGGGTPTYGGYVAEIEKNPDLRGPRKYVTYNNNVRNCDAVAVGVRALTMLCGGVPWDVDPPQTEDAAASGKPPAPGQTPGQPPIEEDGEGDTMPGLPPGKRPKPKVPAPPRPARGTPPPANKLAPGYEPEVEEDTPDEEGDDENPLDAQAMPTVDPAVEAARAKAKWLKKVLFEDMESPWVNLIKRLCMFKFHGFSVHEVTYCRRDDGTIGIADVENRPQATIEKWDLDKSGTVQGAVQRIPLDATDAYIPRWKMVYIVDDELADGDPSGVGLLRHSAEKVRQINRLEALEGQGYETDLRGIPITKVPLAELNAMVASGKLSQAKMDEIVKPYWDFMRGHVRNPKLAMMVDSTPYRSLDANGTPSATPMWGVELLTGDGQSHEAVRIAIDGKHREVARTMFAEGFMLGGDGGSNRALGEEKGRFFADHANGVLTDICNALNRDLVHPLWALNGYPVEERPTLRFEAVSIEDATRIAEMLEKMAKAGAKLDPTDPVVNTVRTRARLPKVSDEIMAKQAQQAVDMAQAEVDATRAGTTATIAGVEQGDKKLDMDAQNAEADRELSSEQLRAKEQAAKKPAAGKRPPGRR